MAFTGKLAELFIEFTTRGATAVLSAMNPIKSQLEGMHKGAEAVGKVGTIAFASASASITGWAAAGLRGTVIADRLAFQMDRIALSVAGAFRPELEKAVAIVQRAANWIQNLSDQQRESYANWIKGGLAAAFVASVLPRVFSGLTMVATGIKAVAVSTGILHALTGNILPLIGGLIAGFTALAVGTEVGRGALSGLWEALEPVLQLFKELAALGIKAMQPLFAALSQSFQAVAAVVTRVLPTMRQAFGILGASVARLAETLAPLGLLFAQTIGAIMEATSPLVPVIAELVGSIVDVFGQAFAVIGQSVLGLVKLVGPTLMSALVSLAKLVAAVIIPVFKILAGTLKLAADALAFLTGTQFKGGVTMAPSKTPGARSPFAPASHGFETLDQQYERLTLAAMRAGMKSPEQEHLEISKEQLVEAKKTNDILGAQKPEVSRS